MTMHHTILSETITYDGSQLHSHWIFERTGFVGDAIVAFCGPAAVNAVHMVDEEDRARSAWIHSDEMLHFIIEHFGVDLLHTVALQRLLMAIVAEEIGVQTAGVPLTQPSPQRERGADAQRFPAGRVYRRGNDLYDGENKLSVSIATVSPVSTLIHAGINILHTNTPVPTRGLHDYTIDPTAFAQQIITRYCDEVRGIAHARAKVRAVR